MFAGSVSLDELTLAAAAAADVVAQQHPTGVTCEPRAFACDTSSTALLVHPIWGRFGRPEDRLSWLRRRANVCLVPTDESASARSEDVRDGADNAEA